MWAPTFEAVCRENPELVAVFESPHGRLALLLRHTLVPLPHERTRWSAETRLVANVLTKALRSAGNSDAPVVLQWRPLRQVVHILRRWPCRYDADPARRAELSEIAIARLGDRRRAAVLGSEGREDAPVRREDAPVRCDDAPVGREDAPVRYAPASIGPEVPLGRAEAPLLASVTSPRVAGGADAGPVDQALIAWYRNMAPTWLGAEPIVRRQLILRTHRWIVECVFAPGDGSTDAPTQAPALSTVVDQLAPTGQLAQALVATVPAGELPRWKLWIRLVLADLRRALSWPASERNGAWGRWLFLIPYSIPVRQPDVPSLTARLNGWSRRS